MIETDPKWVAYVAKSTDERGLAEVAMIDLKLIEVLEWSRKKGFATKNLKLALQTVLYSMKQLEVEELK